MGAMELILSAVWHVALYLTSVLMLLFFAIVFLISQLKLLLIRMFFTFGKPFEILSGVDAVFQQLGPTSFADSSCGSVIQAMALLSGDADIVRLRQEALDRVVLARDQSTGAKLCPRLTQRLVQRFGYYVWEEDLDFSIDRHIRLSDTCYTDDASLIKLAMAEACQPLAPERPLWEIILIPKLSGGAYGSDRGSYAVWFRLSHSYMDGMGLIRVCALMCDQAAERKLGDMEKVLHLMKTSLPPVYKHNPLLRYLAAPKEPLDIFTMTEIFLNAVKLVASGPWTLVTSQLHNRRNALHGPPLSGRKLMAVSEPLALEFFKDVAKAFNCSVSEVFYSCITASFRQCDNSATPVKMMATYTLLKPGNRFSENCFGYFPMILPVTHMDAGERLKCISQIAQCEKMSPRPIHSYFAIHAFVNHDPFGVMKTVLANSTGTILATNLYGPPFKISIVGDPVIDVFFIPQNACKMGVGFSFCSYNGFARVGVNVDRAVAPDDGIADKLIAGFVHELKQLQAMTSASY